MIRFILKPLNEMSMRVKTVDVVVPELERAMDRVDSINGKMIIIGMEQLPSCDICFKPDCVSDHK